MVQGLTKETGPQAVIDEKVFQSLKNNSRYFIELLGQPRKEGDGFVFPAKDLLFTNLHVRYEVERKFLGKIYVMVLEGRFPRKKPVLSSEKMELRYSGFFKKGKPFFISSKKAENNGGQTLKLLNADPRLIDACWKLDVEFLKVTIDSEERVWKVRLRPYGGSFIKILLPPLQYNVALSKDQAERILFVMKRIAELITAESPTDKK